MSYSRKLPERHKDKQGEVRKVVNDNGEAKRIENLKRGLAEAEATIAQLQHDLSEVEQSIVWRSSRPIRAILKKIPARNRARAFNFARSMYRRLRYGLLRRLGSHIVPRLLPAVQTAVASSDEIARYYRSWIETFDTRSRADREQMTIHIGSFRTKPVISIVMPVYNTPEPILREAIDSVIQQIYPHWELCIADDHSSSPHVRATLDEYSRQDARIKCSYRETNGHISESSNTALELASGEYVALLDHDDMLSDHALYMVAEAIQRHATAELLYSDEDKLDADGQRCEPHFKPDWSPELFYGQNYLNHLSVYKRAAIERCGGFRVGFEGSQDYDLALRVICTTKEPIVHIPHILYHWRIFNGAGTMSSGNPRKAVRAARRALEDHFANLGMSVAVGDVMGSFHRILRSDPASWPKVSVVVPTRDYLDVLRVTIDGLLTNTDYPDLEILIADNESAQAETLVYLAEVEKQGVHVIKCDGVFNYSAINNTAVAASTGEYILLLNNDISMIDPGWLKEMVRYLLDPEIGIVGAKLLYPDGTVQHAGVTIGIGGVAGHRYLRASGTEPGLFCRLALAQDVSAVTGACLLIRRAIYDEVGGLDAQNLTVAFNDIDLCLRVRSAGYRIIWTPHAVLEHHESKSRGSDLIGEKQLRFEKEAKFMRAKWGHRLLADPFFNPNLSLTSLHPALAYPPRVRRPWKT